MGRLYVESEVMPEAEAGTNMIMSIAYLQKGNNIYNTYHRPLSISKSEDCLYSHEEATINLALGEITKDPKINRENFPTIKINVETSRDIKKTKDIADSIKELADKGITVIIERNKAKERPRATSIMPSYKGNKDILIGVSTNSKKQKKSLYKINEKYTFKVTNPKGKYSNYLKGEVVTGTYREHSQIGKSFSLEKEYLIKLNEQHGLSVKGMFNELEEVENITEV